MTTTQREAVAVQPVSGIRVSPIAAVAVALSFGLCGGFLDVTIIFLSKYFWHNDGYFRTARDFPWTVPLGHAVLLFLPGIVVAAVSLRPRGLSLRTAAWIFASLALMAALMRAPLYPACSVLLAIGLGRLIGDRVAALGQHPRRLAFIMAGLVVALGLSAACSTGWQAVREHRVVAGLPGAPEGARNVILIVWDTVRAYNVSSYGYFRDTTPNLTRWAKKGVQYNLALAAAPWTYPSHTCFFTGQWPFQLNSQWKYRLDTPDPTIAEYLASHGYQTAGFAANTSCCSYETGLSRGFTHYEDYSLTPLSLLTRTVPGKWMLTKALSFGDWKGIGFDGFYEKKWFSLESRGAREINDRFLDWLSRRRSDRPFFAFLNYFDAHDPFIPPPGYEKGFGIRPRTQQDYQYLFGYVGSNKRTTPRRDLLMARDCYDDCIFFLDERLNDLLSTLSSQGLLENTAVVITSDHGEGFGDNGIFGHSYTVNLDEVAVPLVILAPGSPAGRVVDEPVSLRDVPATVVDLVGLSARSPFSGRSLADHWKPRSAQDAPLIATPAFSERADGTALHAQAKNTLDAGWFQMSVVASGAHYLRDSLGEEKLYNLKLDPGEQIDLMRTPEGPHRVDNFRKMLLGVLTDYPASAEVENSYLKPFRERLKELVKAPDRPGATASVH